MQPLDYEIPLKLAVTGGGTGGHVAPGMAVCRSWILHHGPGTLLWIGKKAGIEERMVAMDGIPFQAVSAEALKRSANLSNLKMPLRVWKGFLQSRKLLREYKADVLLATGGYVSLPAGLAAVSLKIPVVLHESNAVLGLANRILAVFSNSVCFGFEPASGVRKNHFVTGNPVRLKPQMSSRVDACSRFELQPERKTLLVLPGSGAAHSINKSLLEWLETKGAFPPGWQILWMTGNRDLEEVRKRTKFLKDRVHCEVFIDHVDDAYAVADLVLGRAGASTLSELSAAGRPALLIPYPYATADHQQRNAMVFQQAGAARILKDQNLSAPALNHYLRPLMLDGEVLAGMSEAMKKLAPWKAVEKVEHLLQTAALQRRGNV